MGAFFVVPRGDPRHCQQGQYAGKLCGESSPTKPAAPEPNLFREPVMLLELVGVNTEKFALAASPTRGPLSPQSLQPAMGDATLALIGGMLRALTNNALGLAPGCHNVDIDLVLHTKCMSVLASNAGSGLLASASSRILDSSGGSKKDCIAVSSGAGLAHSISLAKPGKRLDRLVSAEHRASCPWDTLHLLVTAGRASSGKFVRVDNPAPAASAFLTSVSRSI